MSIQAKQVRIAIIAIVCIAIIYFGILFLKNMSLRASSNSYVVEISDVNGLSSGAEVLANGMVIGSVKSLHFNAAKQVVDITIELNDGFQLPLNTKATLTKDMLGSPKMNIILGSNPDLFLTKGDTIQGFPMLDIMSEGAKMLPLVEAMLPKMDSILALTQELLASNALHASLTNMETITANLVTTTSSINELMQQQLPQTISKLNKTLNDADAFALQLGTIDFALLADNTNHTLSELQLFANKLNNPSSSLGKLLNEDLLYQRMDSTITNAAMLLEDLRLHPKRYVHFSIW